MAPPASLPLPSLPPTALVTIQGTGRAEIMRPGISQIACPLPHIASDFLSSLQSRMAEILPPEAGWDLYVDPEDGHIVNFRYPTTVEKVPYIRPEVRLELGTHAEFIPNDHYTVRPYAAENYPEAFDRPDCTVRAIKIERTFWGGERGQTI